MTSLFLNICTDCSDMNPTLSICEDFNDKLYDIAMSEGTDSSYDMDDNPDIGSTAVEIQRTPSGRFQNSHATPDALNSCDVDRGATASTSTRNTEGINRNYVHEDPSPLGDNGSANTRRSNGNRTVPTGKMYYGI